MGIERKIKIRTCLKEWLDMGIREVQEKYKATQAEIDVALERLFPVTELVATEKPGTMTEEEAAKFARSPMRFGAHAGKPIIDVPCDYLEWLDREPDFRVQLGRYISSSYYARNHKGCIGYGTVD